MRYQSCDVAFSLCFHIVVMESSPIVKTVAQFDEVPSPAGSTLTILQASEPWQWGRVGLGFIYEMFILSSQIHLVCNNQCPFLTTVTQSVATLRRHNGNRESHLCYRIFLSFYVFLIWKPLFFLELSIQCSAPWLPLRDTSLHTHPKTKTNSIQS